MEFKVPPLNESKISSYLKESLNIQLDILKIEVKKEYVSRLFEFNNFQHYLPTIRDVKRFLNSYLIKYNLVSNRVDFTTFFFFELFFYKHKDSFSKLYSERVRFLSIVQRLVKEKEVFNTNTNSLFIDLLGLTNKYSNPQDVDLLNKVFFNETEKSFISNLNQYFVLSGYDELEFNTVFNLLKDSDDDVKKDTLIKWIKNGYLDDILLFFNEGVRRFSSRYVKSYVLDNIKTLDAVYSKIDENKSDVVLEKKLTSISLSVSDMMSKIEIASLDDSFTEIYSTELVSKNKKNLQEQWAKLNKQSITSDSKTKFVSSNLPAISSLPSANAFDLNPLHSTWTDNSNQTNVFNGAKWISRSKELSYDERLGGDYVFTFERDFYSLTNGTFLSKAILYVMADDFVTVSLNNVQVHAMLGYDVLQNPDVTKGIDLKNYIKPGLNKLRFDVKNHPLRGMIDANQYSHVLHQRQNTSHNPYGLIYSLQIE